jgi:hypothetical protein
MPLPPRARAGLFTELDPDLVVAVRREARERGRTICWVVETALLSGLPLLPDKDEELHLAG